MSSMKRMSKPKKTNKRLRQRALTAIMLTFVMLSAMFPVWLINPVPVYAATADSDFFGKTNTAGLYFKMSKLGFMGGGDSTDPKDGTLLVNDPPIGGSMWYPNNLTYTYCNKPDFKIWIGNEAFSSTDAFINVSNAPQEAIEKVLTEGNITYSLGFDSATAGDEQKAEVTWTFTLKNNTNVTLKWSVAYIMGNYFLNHNWSLTANQAITDDIVIYYAGHHTLGGGTYGGFSNYNNINSAILTWPLATRPENEKYIYMLRSDSGEPAGWYSDTSNDNLEESYPEKGTDYPKTPGIDINSLAVNHTVSDMNWRKTGGLNANEVYQVEATEAILPGPIAVIAPFGKTVPSPSTGKVYLTYDFTLKNLFNGKAEVIATPSISDGYPNMNGWRTYGDGKNPDVPNYDPGIKVKFSEYGEEQIVSVYVEVPSNLQDGNYGDCELTVTLDPTPDEPHNSTLKSAFDNATPSGTVRTTIDQNAAIITNVQEMNVNTLTMGTLVEWMNNDTNPVGNEVRIEIWNENGTEQFTDGVAYNVQAPGNTTLPAPTVINIDTAGTGVFDLWNEQSGEPHKALQKNTTYRIKASVEGIPYPDFHRTFIFHGNDTYGSIWQDRDVDNTRQDHEGLTNIGVVLEERQNAGISTDPADYIFTTDTIARGAFNFLQDTTRSRDQDNRVNNAYVLYPYLDPEQYAVVDIKVFANVAQGTSVIEEEIIFDNTGAWDTSLASSSLIEILDKIKIGSTEYTFTPTSGAPKNAIVQNVEYQFKDDISATVPIRVEFQIGPSAIIKVFSYTGNDSTITGTTPPAIIGGVIETIINGNSLGQITMLEVPYYLSLPAGTAPKVTYTAPLGYRLMSTKLVQGSQTLASLNAFKPSEHAYPVNFQLYAGDVRLTGVSPSTTATPSAVAATDVQTPQSKAALTSDWAGVTALLDFDAWGDAGKITNPTRSDYVWTVVSDTAGILAKTGDKPTGINSSTGEVTFTNQTGTAVVKVALATDTLLYHEMEIELGVAALDDYESIYIAMADDITLKPVTNLALMVANTKEVVVVGIKADETKVKLPNTQAALLSDTPGILTCAAVDSDLYKFRLTGMTRGNTPINASYTTATQGTLSAQANVLVTTNSLVGARIEITPGEITLASGGVDEQVTYTLVFSNNSTQVLSPAQVFPTLSPNQHATLASNDTLQYSSDGTTYLSAYLIASPNVKTNTPAKVNCVSGGGVVTPEGVLYLVEDNADYNNISNTGGIIPVDGTAEYFAFFDQNGDGLFDPTKDTLLKYGTANTVFSANNSHFNTKIGVGSSDNVLITGLSEGADQLTVTYTLNGKEYKQSTPILVHQKGYTLDSLKIEPNPVVLYESHTQTFTVYAVLKASSGVGTQEIILPENFYNGSVSNSANGPYISLVAGSVNRVLGVKATGEEIYTATLKSDSSKTANAQVLVIPQGARLAVDPNPIWIQLDNTGNVTYRLFDNTNKEITSVSNLEQYIAAKINAVNIAEFHTPGDFKTIEGKMVGRTVLEAYFATQLSTKQSVTIYVFNNTNDPSNNPSIAFNPTPITVHAGYTNDSKVVLVNELGTLTDTSVDLDHLVLVVTDSSKASIPSNNTGIILTVTGGNVSVNTSTTLSAAPKNTNASALTGKAILDVNVITGSSINGFILDPTVIELWPESREDVTVLNAGTGQSLTKEQLEALIKTYSTAGHNDTAVNEDIPALSVSQLPAVPIGGSFNILTVESGSSKGIVYIINYKNTDNKTRKLVLNPDPVTMIKDGLPESVKVYLETYDNAGYLVDKILLPAELVTTRVVTTQANTSNLPGRIVINPDNGADTLSVKGTSAGAQTYRVSFNCDPSIYVDGRAFVFAQDPNLITDFALVPDNVAVPVGGVANVQGLITYKDGSEQIVTSSELPIAIEYPGLQSDDPNIASISNNGFVQGQQISNLVEETFVTGTLIGTSLVGRADILVYKPSAELTIKPADTTIFTQNSSGYPTQDILQTYLDNVIVPNKYLYYVPDNTNIVGNMIAPDSYSVSALATGNTVVTAQLRGTNKKATANVHVLNGSLTYYDVSYDPDLGTVYPAGTPWFVDNYIPAGSNYQVLRLPNYYTGPANAPYFSYWSDNTASVNSSVYFKPGDFISNLSSSLTLYAIWTDEAPDYTVTLDPNNGDSVKEIGPCKPGDVINLGDDESNNFDPPSNDQRFSGWNTKPDGTGDYFEPNSEYAVDSDSTVYAVWKQVYKLSLVADPSGSGSTADHGVTYYGKLYTTYYLPGETPRIEAVGAPGYTFLRWNSNNSGAFAGSFISEYASDTYFTMPPDDVILTAHFTKSPDVIDPDHYILTLNDNPTGSSATLAGAGSYTAGAVVNISTTPKSGYRFVNWTDENGNPIATNASFSYIMSAQNTALTANFQTSGGGGGGGGGSSNTNKNTDVDDLNNKDEGTKLGDLLNLYDHMAYMNGYPDGSVKPARSITRAEAAAIFYRLLNEQGNSANGTFQDVKTGAWYTNSVNYLASIGIISGYPDGTFKPDQNITRAEFATIASRFDQLESVNNNTFSDVKADYWGVSFINSAYAKGWVSGYPDNTFKPANPITRAEVVTTVNRMLNRAIDDESLAQIVTPYNDITKEHWSYPAFIEASIAHDYERNKADIEQWIKWGN